MDSLRWYEDPIYIKMCGKAEEIQKLWKPFNGCYIIQKDYEQFPVELRQPIVLHFCNDSILVSFDKSLFIWLLRQDQLQEIYRDIRRDNVTGVGQETLYSTIVSFYLWIKNNFIEYAGQFLSMEQLWLAFVMEEKFNKVWDGKKWLEKFCRRKN